MDLEVEQTFRCLLSEVKFKEELDTSLFEIDEDLISFDCKLEIEELERQVIAKDEDLKTVCLPIKQEPDEVQKWPRECYIKLQRLPDDVMEKYLRKQNEIFPKCDQCGRSFSYIGSLKTHIRIVHQNIRPYECKTCFRRFSNMTNLDCHVRTHTKERPFKCNHCNKKFTQSSSLKTHITIVHLNQKLYNCSICEMAFTNPTNVQSHMRSTHLKEKPFVCLQCGRDFIQNVALKRHLVTVHSKDKVSYDCLHCSQCFGSNGYLQRHIQSEHNDVKGGLQKKMK